MWCVFFWRYYRYIPLSLSFTLKITFRIRLLKTALLIIMFGFIVKWSVYTIYSIAICFFFQFLNASYYISNAKDWYFNDIINDEIYDYIIGNIHHFNIYLNIFHNLELKYIIYINLY